MDLISKVYELSQVRLTPVMYGLWFVKLSSRDSQEVKKNERLWCRALVVVRVKHNKMTFGQEPVT